MNLLFLRFVCPIVVKPVEYKILEGSVSTEKVQDLIMVAKVLQTLANFQKFGSKEEAMTALNPFLEKNVSKIRSYFLEFIDVVRLPFLFLSLYLCIGNRLDFEFRFLLAGLHPRS